MAEPRITVETLTGAAMQPHLPALQRLRAAVFREFPYLWNGEPGAGSTGLAGFAASPTAALVLACADGEPVGAATCRRLDEESEAVRAGFAPVGLDPAAYFYFGESVLLAPWRGRGIGLAFFAQREARARAVSDCAWACFCAVRRPADDPARPPGHAPLDRFWSKRGYAPVPGLACEMRWREVGGAAEEAHVLDFWAKRLRETPG